MSKVKRDLSVMINAKMSKTITKKEIYGAEHIVIENCGSIVSDSVMNGVLYPASELEKLASETVGHIHAPAGHPKNSDGNFISSGSTEGIHQGYIGAISFNYRMSGDRLVRDIAIDPEKAAQSEAGREVLKRIESEQDTDTSTGLLLNLVDEEGFGKDGEPYAQRASNMMLDHDAILLSEQGAAGSDEGVGLFANHKGETVTAKTFDVNASTPALSMPLSSADFNEAEAIERIKKYTGSEKKPSSNYRKFFLEFDRDNADDFKAYSMPFADIIDVDGVMTPHAMLKAIEKYSEDGAVQLNQERLTIVNSYLDKIIKTNTDKEAATGIMSVIKSIINKLTSALENSKTITYNSKQQKDVTLTNLEDHMRDLILNKLKADGVDVSAMNDDQLFATYNAKYAKAKDGEEMSEEDKEMSEADLKKKAKMSKEDDNKAMNEAITAAIAPLTATILEMQTKANTKQDAELTALATQVEALNIGMNQAQAKALGVDGMTSVIKASGGTVVFNSTSTHNQSDKDQYAMPSFD